MWFSRKLYRLCKVRPLIKFLTFRSVHSSTSPCLPDPTFRFFEGLAPRLLIQVDLASQTQPSADCLQYQSDPCRGWWVWLGRKGIVLAQPDLNSGQTITVMAGHSVSVKVDSSEERFIYDGTLFA